ncbi:MAG: CRISPR-associated protein Cas4 [Thermoproteus sp.]|nr:CRISPR-associated protein Cas4 [Thermoproteus sp.]
MTFDEALRELSRTDKVERLSPTTYAVAYDFKRVSPSMINDYEYCPRLLWLQAKEGKKFLTRRSLVALVRGRLFHERYERALSNVEDIIAEYKIEVGDMVGVVDLIFKRNGKLIPIEVKSGLAPKEAHVKQLQIYIELLGADFGYLVYRNRVERVERNQSVLVVLDEIKRLLRSPDPPPVQGSQCRYCPFKEVCYRA